MGAWDTKRGICISSDSYVSSFDSTCIEREKERNTADEQRVRDGRFGDWETNSKIRWIFSKRLSTKWNGKCHWICTSPNLHIQ